MRTRPLASTRALAPTVAATAAPRPRRPFRLDATTLAMARASAVLALDPSAIGALFSLQASEPAMSRDERGVALVSIIGPLSQRADEYDCGFGDGYDKITARVQRACEDKNSRAIVLRIDSPGGDVAGLQEAVRQMRAAIDASGKPCAVYVDELAASAAYWIASALSTAGIVVPESGGVGSVGTIASLVDESEALEHEGVKIELIRDPPGKAAGHPYQPITDLARERLTGQVREATARFVAAVSAARGLAPDVVRGLDGDVRYGAAAVEAGLADKVGSFDDAITLALAKRPQAAKAAPAPAARATGNRTPTRARRAPALRAEGPTTMADYTKLIDACKAASAATKKCAEQCDKTAEIAATGVEADTMAAAEACMAACDECCVACDACMVECAAVTGQPMPESAAAAMFAATGKRTIGEAVGAIEAMKSQASRLSALAGEVAQMKAKAARDEATKLLDDAQRSRKFGGGEAATAARAKAEGLFAKFGLDALQAHLDALTPAGVAAHEAPVEPETKGRAADSAKDATPPAKAESPKHDGKTFEQMTPREKHALRASGPEGERTYQAMRAEWESRGKPKAA